MNLFEVNYLVPCYLVARNTVLRLIFMARVTIPLITVAFVAEMAGCTPTQYNLTISTTEVGEVTTPGEGTFTYGEGMAVGLVVIPDAGYQFVEWTGDVRLDPPFETTSRRTRQNRPRRPATPQE
jgi:hypothetical protein